MDQVIFYKKCDEVLSLLLKEKPVDLSEIRDISPEYYRAILQEFEEKKLTLIPQHFSLTIFISS